MNAPSLRFAAAAARLAAPRTSPAERRRFRRSPLVVGGRMLDAHGREHDCRTADISPGDARLAAPVSLASGDRIVLYLESLGRVSGRIVRPCEENQYALVFEASVHKREKMAETLTWMLNRTRLGLDAASPATNTETRYRIKVELENGDTIDGAVLDFSLAGVTVRALRRPPLGAWVRVGSAYGRVARQTDTGFAVDFDLPNGRTQAG